MSEPTTILIASLLLLIPHAALGQTAFDANFDGSGKIDLLDFVEFVLAFEAPRASMTSTTVAKSTSSILSRLSCCLIRK